MTIESFSLDHTTIKSVPHLRISAKIPAAEAINVYKFDWRLVTPNTGEMTSSSIHTIEHLMAINLSALMENDPELVYIDLSPMGCKTGYYFTALCKKNIDDKVVLQKIGDYFTRAMEKAVKSDMVPFATEKQCGNYLLHNLPNAIDFLNQMLQNKLHLVKTVDGKIMAM